MAITGASLADGQLPNAPGDLYVSVGVTYEKILNLCNVGGATETIKIYFLRVSGTNVRKRLKTISLDPDQAYELNIPLPMSPGDKIQGETTNASAVDYVLGGGVA